MYMYIGVTTISCGTPVNKGWVLPYISEAGEEQIIPGDHRKMNILPTGRIKAPLRGPMITEEAPHRINAGPGDRIVFTVRRANQQYKNVSINKVEILAPLAIIGMLEIKKDIFIQGVHHHRTGKVWRIGPFEKGKIGVPHLDETDPHMRDHNTIFLLKDPLHRGQDFLQSRI